MKAKIFSLIILFILLFSLPQVNNVNVSGETTTPKYGGTLVIPIATDPSTFCPVLIQTDQDNLPHQNIFNALVRMDKNLQPIPDLAKSWEISADSLTYTFHLYNNVTWHDGKPFTSADVKFTFDLYRQMALPMSSTFAAITSIDTPDSYTVVFHLKSPFAPLMTTGFGFWRGNKIMPKHLYEGTDIVNNPYNLKPVGTGPFMFKEWVKGDHITLVRNPNYFEKNLPYLDKIILKVAPLSEATLIGLETGEYSYVGISTADLTKVQSMKNVTVLQSIDGGYSCQYIGLNRENKYLGDLRVRQAIAYSINKDEFIKLILAGYAKPSISFLSSSMGWAFNPNVPQYQYDPVKAEQLLDEAGFNKDASGVRFQLRLYTMTETEWVNAAQVLRAQLKKVGIDVEVMPLEWATLFDKFATQYDFDMVYMGHGTGPDPDRLYGRFLSTEIKPGTWQYMRYNNSQVDQLWAASRKTAVISERQELFYQIQEIIMKDLPMIPLFERISFSAFRSEFHNVPPRQGYGSLDIWADAWTEKGSVISPTTATQVIDSTEKDLNTKKSSGFDVTSAEKKLSEAKDAYNKGQYDSAKLLAEAALKLAIAPPPPEPPINWALIVAGVVVTAAVAIYVLKIRKP